MIRIIGGGFSGLSLAYHFVKLGLPVTIVEKKSQVGGVIQSSFQNDMLVESAANGLLSSKKIEDLLKDIGVKPLKTRVESQRKYIFRGRLRRWPLSFFETLDLIVKVIRSFVSQTRYSRPGESLRAWAERVVGPIGATYLIQPMVNGVFAQTIDLLNAKMVLGSMMYPRESGRLKGLISAEGGMGEIISKLQQYLSANGAQFLLQTDEIFDLNSLQHNTFLAIDLFSFQKSLTHFKSEKYSLKKLTLSSLSLARITLNFKNKTREIDGFGVLFPNTESFNALGVLANTKIFSHRGEYNESWIFSDSTAPNLMSWTDEEIIQKIRVDRKRLFSDNFEIKNYVIHRWPKVIPDYNSDLAQFLADNPKLTNQLAGNYLGVLGLTGIHERNALIAKSYFTNKDSI